MNKVYTIRDKEIKSMVVNMLENWSHRCIIVTIVISNM